MYGNNEQIKATKTFHDHQIVLCIKLNKRKKENKKKTLPEKIGKHQMQLYRRLYTPH